LSEFDDFVTDSQQLLPSCVWFSLSTGRCSRRVDKQDTGKLQ
jgi:hypothetical protein